MAEALLLAREELYKWGLARAKGILALVPNTEYSPVCSRKTIEFDINIQISNNTTFSIAHRNEYLRGLVDCSPSKSLTFSEVGVLDAEAQRS
uniref:Uncharacterized protein n=1 Tax=Oryza rufipogon TaxID=4529 RepID=A0A0E0MWY2_ORYRU